MQSDSIQVGKNTVALFVSHVFIKIINFVYIVFLARHLGEQGLGQLTFASAFVEVLSILSDFGLTTVTVREVSRNRQLAGTFLKNVLALRLLISSAVFVIIITVAHLSGFTGDVLIAIYLYALANLFLSFSFTYQSILNAFEKMQYGSAISIAVTALISATGLVFIGFGLGVAWFASLQLLWAVPSGLTFIWCGRRESIRFGLGFDRALWGSIVRSAIPVGFGVAMYVIYNRVDLIMLQYMKTDYDVGIYSVAYRMMGYFHFLIWALMGASAPAFSKYFRKDPQKLRELADRNTRYLLCAGIPIAVGGSLCASQIMRFLYAGKFAEAAGVFSLLAFSTAIIFFGATFGTILLNADSSTSRFYARIATGGVIFNIFLNVLLIPRFSYFGAAAATVATDLLTSLCAYFYVNLKIIRIQVVTPLMKALASVALMAIPVLFLRESGAWLPWIVAVGATVFTFAAIAFRLIWKEDLRMLQALFMSYGSYHRKVDGRADGGRGGEE